MTKKNITIVIIVALILMNIFQFKNTSNVRQLFETYETSLRDDKYSSDEQLIDMKTKLNVTRNELETINKDIYVYTRIITDLFNNLEFNYLRELYDFNAYFLVANKPVNLPKNGTLYTSHDSITFKAELTPMPSVGNFQINELLQNNMFQPIFQTLYYPSADESIETNNKLELTYDLDVGESIQFKLKNIFKESFGLDIDTIKIERFDPKDYKEGADYYISRPMVKIFSFEEELTHFNYYEVTKDYVTVRQGSPSIELDSSYDNKIYIFNGAVGFNLWEQSVNNPMNELDNVILPGSIFIGYEWAPQYSDIYYVITDLDVDIEVMGKTMKCLEVSTFYDDRLTAKSYYAEGIGEVKSIYTTNGISELVGLDYLE